jgi:hypothetical protein
MFTSHPQRHRMPQTQTKPQSVLPPNYPPVITATAPVSSSGGDNRGLIFGLCVVLLLIFVMAFVYPGEPLIWGPAGMLVIFAAFVLWARKRSLSDPSTPVETDSSISVKIERQFLNVFAMLSTHERESLIQYYMAKHSIDRYAAMKAAIDDRQRDEEWPK